VSPTITRAGAHEPPLGALAVVAAEQIEQRRAEERADHDVGQHRMHGVPEPGAAEGGRRCGHAQALHSPAPSHRRGREPVAPGRTARMASAPLQERGPFAGHSPDRPRPLGGYGALMASFLALSGGFGAWLRGSGRELPERPSASDLALITVATHKASRLVAKDRVASTLRAPFTRFQDDAGAGEVSEAARGRGLRRAIGELPVCPYCLSVWIAAGFAAGLIVAPRPTRWIAAVFATVFGSDVLQIVYKKAEDSL
jgi:hypothetical protein